MILKFLLNFILIYEIYISSSSLFSMENWKFLGEHIKTLFLKFSYFNIFSLHRNIIYIPISYHIPIHIFVCLLDLEANFSTKKLVLCVVCVFINNFLFWNENYFYSTIGTIIIKIFKFLCLVYNLNIFATSRI